MSLGGVLAKAVVAAAFGAGAEQMLGIDTPPDIPRVPKGQPVPVTNDDEVQAYLRSLPQCCGQMLVGRACSKCGARAGKQGK